MIFDGQHKGYIIEDDCMEILYARYGGYGYNICYSLLLMRTNLVVVTWRKS